MSNVFYTARKTLRNYANGGNVLMMATALALVIVNVPFFTNFYNSLWIHELRLQIGDFNLFSHNGHPMSIMDFINDALMAIFFFSVGLEIKREVLVGELSSFRQALLPIVAAIGGMGIPVLIFWLFAKGTPYAGGAAIPMATDIAFSLGVLAMLGNRVPISLKIFLTTLAVVDDIGGILVIAIFYSTHINFMLLIGAAILLGILTLGGLLRIQSKLFYLGIGAFVWFLFLNAGIHPTIAGVLIAFCVPARPVYAPKGYIKTIRKNIDRFAHEDVERLKSKTILNKDQLNWLKEIETASDKVISPLQDLEDTLHPLVNYLIVPLFAFANAGIFLGDLEIGSILTGISRDVILGLVLGKFLGILSFSWICVKLKWAPMPEGCNWKQMASISMLGGIGFTVSLFIANLSFGTGDPILSEILNNAKLGILVGSLIAGFLGWLFLHITLPKEPQSQGDED
ncbi:MAG: Na+/H+ antiporter NhaA [Prevotella sp.]|nr:Na+/H+ antiporter NhaA [Bacteroides sp.]MCM1366085.1 Na+/H+ antiporter NhaA [Prevotella sp.]MCM1436570.1 Na+/H+ antiporter NhaA [Prevotella sp.]